MSLRDYRCLYSGVSLLGAETALVFIGRDADGNHRPVSLPLFGRYLGHGVLGEVNEGPNTDLIVDSFVSDLAAGRAQISWQELGLEAFEITCIDELIAVVACAQVHSGSALTWRGSVLGFSLFEAHVLAALSEREPTELASGLAHTELPDLVLGAKERGATLYRALGEQALRLQLRFALSFVGLQSLIEAMKAADKSFDGPGAGLEICDAKPERWLAEALLEWGDQQTLIEALEEYASAEEDELAD